MDNDIKKRFPADTSLDKTTFLNNKHINGELYAYLQSLSTVKYNQNKDEYYTIVEYHNLPTQKAICQTLGISSPKTYKTHLQHLIDNGFVKEIDDGYELLNVEDMFFYIPLDTLRYLRDNCKEHVIKIYIYLGQKYKYAESVLHRKYEFSIDELAKHIGLKTNNNSRVYEVINHALELLYNSGLIDYCKFYDGQIQKKKLLSFSYEYKKKDGENYDR